MIASVQLGSIGAILQERFLLTLEQVAVSPVHTGVMLTGRLFGMLLPALAAWPVAWLIIIVLFGWVPIPSIGAVLAAIVVGIVSLFSVGLLILGFIARRRYRAGMPNAVFPVLILITGLFVPLSSLPTWVSGPGRLFGLSWAMEGIRAVQAGDSPWSDLLVGLLIGVIAVVLGI
jgi:ABC-2 type transport system permease protein